MPDPSARGLADAQQIASCLEGQRLWGSHTTLLAESFLFGRYPDPSVRKSFLAPIILQADCYWRLVCDEREIAAFEDSVPDVEAISDGEAPVENDSTRRVRLDRFFLGVSAENQDTLTVEHVTLDPPGGVTISFRSGCHLRVEIHDTTEESWLLLRDGFSDLSWVVFGGYHEFPAQDEQ